MIAPNQDFVLGSVPREQAGTAGGALITAQRLGAAIGIAVIGTALFGSGASGGSGSGGSGGAAKIMPQLLHSGQTATAVNLCFIAAAFLCALGLPHRLADQSGAQSGGEKPANHGESPVSGDDERVASGELAAREGGKQ